MKDKNPHIVVGAFIRRSDGRIVLFRSPKWPDLWVPPGGHVEYGEKLENTVKREVFEEAGLSISDISFIRCGEMIPGQGPKTMPHLIYFHYLCSLKDSKITLDNNELTNFKWFLPDEILKSSQSDKRVKDSIKMVL